MLECYWINNEMQSTNSILGCLQCHIRQSSVKSCHTLLSTCAFLYFITDTMQILAQCNLA